MAWEQSVQDFVIAFGTHAGEDALVPTGDAA
jgi:hypothetical protein